MLKKICTLVSLSAVFTLLAVAADVTGKWVAQVPGRDGQSREVVYNLKADGAKLTGTMSGPHYEPGFGRGKGASAKKAKTAKAAAR